jgi:hypothetical protein
VKALNPANLERLFDGQAALLPALDPAIDFADGTRTATGVITPFPTLQKIKGYRCGVTAVRIAQASARLFHAEAGEPRG